MDNSMFKNMRFEIERPHEHEGSSFMDAPSSVNYTIITDGKSYSLTEELSKKPANVWDLLASFGLSPVEAFAMHSFIWRAAWPELEKEHGAEFMDNFWNDFSSEEACIERARVFNATVHKRTDNGQLIATAEQLHKSEDEEPKPETAQAWIDATQIRSYRHTLADWLKDCILNQDAAALRSLADTLAGKKEQWIESNTSDMKHRLLISFCDLLYKKRALPTRAELNKRVGIEPQIIAGPNSIKNVPRYLRQLGLGFLVDGK